MRLKGILITLVILLGVVFAVSNWATLFTPLPIDFLFFTVELPIGITLLAIAVGLSLLFFLVSLLDRAGQLRQITGLERQIATLQAKLERRRLEELEALEQTLGGRFDALAEQIARDSSAVEGHLREGMADFEMRTKERFEALDERVLIVRNELAADIAEAEDALRRQVHDQVHSDDTPAT